MCVKGRSGIYICVFGRRRVSLRSLYKHWSSGLWKTIEGIKIVSKSSSGEVSLFPLPIQGTCRDQTELPQLKLDAAEDGVNTPAVSATTLTC